jgi:hypothetical protein
LIAVITHDAPGDGRVAAAYDMLRSRQCERLPVLRA